MGDSPLPFGMMFSSVHEIDPGVITAWSGGLGNIPPGWALCDGTNGTPDLRDKFIPGSGPTFSTGDEGGASPHDHDFTADGHSHTQATYPGQNLDAGTNMSHTTVAPLTGTTDGRANLPPFYALAYIMYIGA